MDKDEHTELLLKDYFNWDSQLVETQALQKELSKMEILRFKASIDFLRKELGEDFPRQVLMQHHPISHYFTNKAPWTRSWFCWLADAWTKFKKISNNDSIFRKFKSGDHEGYMEALAVLETCLKLSNQNLFIEKDI